MTQVNRRRGPLSASEREWLRVRAHLRENRHALSIQASEQLYLDIPRVAGTPLLTWPGWMPHGPIQLERIALELVDGSTRTAAPHPVEMSSLPYSELIERLAAPAVFENRPTYRLLKADLRAPIPRMAFTLGHYFDWIDTGEAVAHEYAAQSLGLASSGRRRAAIGNPVDPGRRPTNVAISALTIRHDRRTGDARFLLHWRDPAKVGHGGGLFQVIPVGIFQPATEHPQSVRNDFSLWRCLVREYAEELLGEDEAPAAAGPIDYQHWTLASRLAVELRRNRVRPYCLGMGVDPLTLATDLLCVVIIDAPVFDQLFAKLVSSNNEGELASGPDGGPGIRFVAEEIDRIAVREPSQAAGAALLRLAWEDRASVLAL